MAAVHLISQINTRVLILNSACLANLTKLRKIHFANLLVISILCIKIFIVSIEQKYQKLFNNQIPGRRVTRSIISHKLLGGLKSEKKMAPLGYQFQKMLDRANQNIYINQREEIKIPSIDEIKN